MQISDDTGLYEKLSKDIPLSEAFFALNLIVGVTSPVDIPYILLYRRAVRELITTSYPPLPKLKSDKAKFPARSLKYKRIDEIKSQLLKFFK